MSKELWMFSGQLFWTYVHHRFWTRQTPPLGPHVGPGPLAADLCSEFSFSKLSNPTIVEEYTYTFIQQYDFLQRLVPNLVILMKLAKGVNYCKTEW